MGRLRLLFCVCLLIFSTWMSTNLCAQSYDSLWEQAVEAQGKDRILTMVGLNDWIYRKALAEKNIGPMLKAYVSREAYKRFLTPDSLCSTLNSLERWAENSTDKVEKAILHSLLACEYAGYWEKNRYRIQERADTALEELSGDMRMWSSEYFVKRVAEHGWASLADISLLVNRFASDYQSFIEQSEGSAYYGHDLCHLLFHRTIDAFEKMVDVDTDLLLLNLSDSLYQRVLDVYTHLPDREEAVILTTLDYWKWKTKNYLDCTSCLEPDSNRESENSCMQMLDKLIERYADYPVIVEAYISKAEWMSHGDKGRSIAEAVRLCDEGIRNYPAYNRIGELHRIRAGLLQPQLSIRSNHFCYPGDTIELNATYRTLDAPVELNIYATNATMSPDGSDCNDDEVFRQCAPRLVYNVTHMLTPLPVSDKLPADVPYLPSDTVLSLPLPSEPGLYVVEMLLKTENGHASRCFLSVSRLRILALDIGNGAVEITALDNRSGRPIAGVTVDFYTGRNKSSLKPLRSVVTAANGKVLVAFGKGVRDIYYVARKGNDCSMPIQTLELSQTVTPTPASHYKLSLFTDRTVYRPGQTVCLKGVAYGQNEDESQVICREPIELNLFDPANGLIAVRKVKTNDFGSFTAEFTLPAVCLNGKFSLSAQGKAEATVHFYVEDYYSQRVGNKAFKLRIFCPSQICKEDARGWMVRAYDNNEESVCQSLHVDWRIDHTPLKRQLSVTPPLLRGTCRTDSLQPYVFWHSLPSGSYRLTITAMDSLGHQVETHRDFVWFSKQDAHPPVHIPLLFRGSCTEVNVGEQASFHIGTSYKDAYLLMDVFTGGKRVDSRVLHLSDTLMCMKIPYLETYGESVTIQLALLREGRRYGESILLKRKRPDLRLNLKWQTFRNHLRPKQEEEWKLVVSHPDGLPAFAEVLAFMYDTSLDHSCCPYPRWNVFSPRDWDEHGMYVSRQSELRLSSNYTLPDLQIPAICYDRFFSPTVRSWVGIGKSKGKDFTIIVMGNPSPRQSTWTQSVRAGMQEDTISEPQSVDEELDKDKKNALRTDFSETAFFYPNLRTNKCGEVRIAFTAPERLTRWNFRCYAHTRDMRTATLEASIVTVKDFMIRPFFPRFLRVGERASITATVTNLTAKTVKGNVYLQLFDPSTGKFVGTYKRRFKVDEGRDTIVRFDFEVKWRYGLLGVCFTADSKNFSDGEQHLLPVLLPLFPN